MIDTDREDCQLLQILDSRRLTGPNLFWQQPGAILDVSISGIEVDIFIQIWSKHCRYLLDALHWHEQNITHRRYQSGVSLVISAPIDALYAATEITEAAFALTQAELQGQTLNPQAYISQLGQAIKQQHNPQLLAIQTAAGLNHVTFLADDDNISLGYGKTAQVYPINALPDVKHIDWHAIEDIPVALVTGTNGKSTTVRLASAIVKAAGFRCGITSTDYIRVGDEILATGDYSGPGGARTILQHAQSEVAVLEVARGGMLRRGLAVNQATTAVITNVAEDHMGEYGIETLADMVAAKMIVRKALNPQQRLILNADDAGIVAFAKNLDNTIVFFSCCANNPTIGTHLANGGSACYVEKAWLVYQTGANKQQIIAINDIPITFAGAAKHNIHNALAAAALCKALGIDNTSIAQGLKDFTSTPENNPGRANLFAFNGIKAMLDFAHNPHGLTQILATMQAFPAQRRLIMLGQAGDRSDESIQQLVKTAIQAQPDMLVVCELASYLRGRKAGEVPKLIEQYALAYGLKPEQIMHAKNNLTGTKKALKWAQSGDVLLLLAITHRQQIVQLLSAQNH